MKDDQDEKTTTDLVENQIAEDDHEVDHEVDQITDDDPAVDQDTTARREKES